MSKPSVGDNCTMDDHPVITQAMLLAYRIANYATINLVDDAAILALMFC
jgi:hypothetical protein